MQKPLFLPSTLARCQYIAIFMKLWPLICRCNQTQGKLFANILEFIRYRILEHFISRYAKILQLSSMHSASHPKASKNTISRFSFPFKSTVHIIFPWVLTRLLYLVIRWGENSFDCLKNFFNGFPSINLKSKETQITIFAGLFGLKEHVLLGLKFSTK